MSQTCDHCALHVDGHVVVCPTCYAKLLDAQDAVDELLAAAKAYRDLNACFRAGRTPREELFMRLKLAGHTMDRYAKGGSS